MIAMQYSIKLPADYDIEIIRRRIKGKGPAFNGMPGLVQKSFLYNESGLDWLNEPTFNEYAPFYVWQSAEAMQGFLFSDKFETLVQSFGRPQVRTWQVLEFSRSGDLDYPAFALRETIAVPDSTSLPQLIETERDIHRQAIKQDNLHSHVVALDVDRWEVVRFSIWRAPELEAKPGTPNFHSYQLLYLAV